MHIPFQLYQEAASFLETLIGRDNRPSVIIVCGSGLSTLADSFTARTKTVDYCDIPGFVHSTALAHIGQLLFGEINGTKVVCMKGRFHCYEGYNPTETAFPIRVFKLLGAKTLIVTNAAGGLNPQYKVGDLMMFSDHLSLPGLAGASPLVGSHPNQFGERFVPISDLYSKSLREALATCWLQHPDLSKSLSLHEGVYGWVFGPNFESRSECRALLSLGCDAVGMSTIPETITAKQCGINTIAISLITNTAITEPEPDSISRAKALLDGQSLDSAIENHANAEEVIQIANSTAKKFALLISDFISCLAK